MKFRDSHLWLIIPKKTLGDRDLAVGRQRNPVADLATNTRMAVWRTNLIEKNAG
jgi:hypothetical protein